jgi:hypothetical protein
MSNHEYKKTQKKKSASKKKCKKHRQKKFKKKVCTYFFTMKKSVHCIKGGAVLSKERERERASERGVCVCVKYK